MRWFSNVMRLRVDKIEEEKNMGIASTFLKVKVKLECSDVVGCRNNPLHDC